MRAVEMTDVGDGLCCQLITAGGTSIHIDCGSQQGPDAAAGAMLQGRMPKVFILSHFHADHYNGLLSSRLRSIPAPYPFWDLEDVYFPRMPSFPEGKEALRVDFACALLATYARAFGDESGVMEFDFLHALSRLTRHSFRYKALYKGCKLVVDGVPLEVRWPPRDADGLMVESVKSALQSFGDACRKDPILQRTFERVRESGVFKPYLSEDSDKCEEASPTGTDRYHDRGNWPYRKENVPNAVLKANKSLRDVANRMSLAFNVGDSCLLFMGDAEAHEIGAIVDDLHRDRKKRFQVLITPHHGTHWSARLKRIQCQYSLSSNGPHLAGLLKAGYKRISKTLLCTHTNGWLIVPFSGFPAHGVFLACRPCKARMWYVPFADKSIRKYCYVNRNRLPSAYCIEIALAQLQAGWSHQDVLEIQRGDQSVNSCQECDVRLYVSEILNRNDRKNVADTLELYGKQLKANYERESKKVDEEPPLVHHEFRLY